MYIIENSNAFQKHNMRTLSRFYHQKGDRYS